ncbi:glycosyltransferase family 4 protein [Psychroserpens sp. Hel_I_66]|uniref:glycosyltransferase family 4 protein n=1 Tax=Psychroserpens sp. Hel_I_66 TaxID=1250004 RepID=UPI0006468F45|nr:glycosyltransferase family 4 protein [Psychroserpens sp. Hel_I_66]
MKKIVRITTISDSLKDLLKGQLGYINQYYDVIGVSSDGESLAQTRENEGIRTEVVEMTRTISPIQDIKAVYKLYKFLRKEKPHIVHTHTPKAGIIGMLAAKLAGVKHRFHTVAGMPLLVATGTKRIILNQVEKLTYSCATKVFPNSFGLKEIILNEGFTTEKKLAVIGKGSSNGIDVEHFNSDLFTKSDLETLKAQLEITKEFIFIYVGRLVSDKGINELAIAFNNFSKKYSSKLILVGWRETDLDPLHPTTEMILKQNKDIIQVGYQKDVRPYFAIADVLVFPSYREGFPNVVLQAGAMNVPSIVSNINGCNEIIKENENGLIIPVKDTKAIEGAMQYLIENPEIYQTMQNKSRKLIVENYRHKYVWVELLKEYQKVN